MNGDIFINNIGVPMTKIKAMVFLRSEDGDLSKDEIRIIYSDDTEETVSCTAQHMVSLAMWQSLKNTILQISLDTIRAKHDLLQKEFAKLQRTSKPGR